jgi:uncharacterized protein
MEVQRIIQTPIESLLQTNKVIVVTGARRVGKTYLLRKIRKKFTGQALELNGDDLDTLDLLNERRTAAYQRWLGSTELLIIDEAQAVPEIGKALKLMIDAFPHLTILVTGSSAFELSNRMGEPLVGRQINFKLYPIAQMELSPYENYIETTQNLENRLLFGSYPEIVLMSETAAKISYLKELTSSYLLKDILMYEQVRNSHKMLQLLQLVAFQVGQEVSLDELGRQLQLDRNTVERYLDLFTKVFIIFKIGGYSRNLRKEVTKSAKWYFFDMGIRNALVNDFRGITQRQDIGQLWENYLLSERMKRNAYQSSYANVFFWRTYDQQEIDWLEEADGQLNVFEIKWNQQKVKFPLGFTKAYPEATTNLINRDNYLEFIG